MERDNIDFGTMHIPRLFVRLFVPTLLTLMFTALFNIADGIFVGKGVGSDALAAINIVAPLFLISTGIALMFGTGASIVAAIHLARDNAKAARICTTQSLIAGTALMLMVAVVVYVAPRWVGEVFGSSERLMPLVLDYMLYIMPSMVIMILNIAGVFIIRLDGAPNYVMVAHVVGSLLNIFLDWLFIFPLHMGVKGAAIATSLTEAIVGLLTLYYICCRARTLRFYRLRCSLKSLRLSLRNVGYMVKMGAPTFVGETAMSCMMIAGNYMFITRLGEDGVAAFSVACYTFPLVFMFGNAVAQSAQPIISYNHGAGKRGRIGSTLRLSLIVAVACSLLTTVGNIWFCSGLIGCFLSSDSKAWQIAVEGFPLFSLSFVFFALNLVLIGYYQALEQARAAIIFMTLRGYLLVIPAFALLPQVVGNDGLWLAVPLSEFLTFACIMAFIVVRQRKRSVSISE